MMTPPPVRLRSTVSTEGRIVCGKVTLRRLDGGQLFQERCQRTRTMWNIYELLLMAMEGI